MVNYQITMYFEEEIKLEDKNSTSCFACLCSNRSLSPLGDYSELFSKFFDYSCMPDLRPILLCWECMAILRKVKLFKRRVDHAQSRLGYHFVDSDTPVCLSNLMTTNIKFISIGQVNSQLNADTEIEMDQKEAEVKEEQMDDDFTARLSCESDKVTTFLDMNNEDYFKYVPQCDHCGLKCESKNDLKEHIRIHMPCLCKICNKWCVNKYLYKQHILINHPKTDMKTQDSFWDMEPIDTDQESEFELEKNGSREKKNFTVVDKVEIEIDNSKPKPRSSIKRHQNKRIMTVTKKATANIIPVDASKVRQWMEKDKESEIFKGFKLKCEKCVREIRCEKYHTQFHVRDSDKSFVCPICEQTFHTIESRQNHVLLCHTSLFRCSECGFKCHLPEVMEFHIWQHNRKMQCLSCYAVFDDKKDYFHHKPKCDHCGVKCKTKERLEKHVLANHLPHICKFCNKHYKSYYKCRKHQMLHHPTPETSSREDSYCVTCDKQFSSPKYYSLHLTTGVAHATERGEPEPSTSGPKPKERVQCTACSKTFADKSYLKKHYQFEHLHDYRFKCEDCGKVYPKAGSLRKHQLEVHKGVKPPKNKYCKFCDRGFSTNRTLRHHIRTHTGERPHQCQYCQSGFTQRFALVGHVKRIHGVILPYSQKDHVEAEHDGESSKSA